MRSRLYPEKSWSHSRDQLFQECPRKYYYQYYGSHGGWLSDASELAQAIYRLKQLLNLYSHFGDVMHHLAEMYINQWDRKTITFSHEELHHRARNLMNQAFLESRDPEQWREAPKRRKMLSEMYYDKQLPKKAVDEIKSRMEKCLTHFLQCDSLQEIVHNDAYRLVETEKLNTFFVGETKVYVKLDALYRHEDGRYVIVDWKTGQEDERIEEQLQLYAYYLHDQFGAPLEKIEIRTEYLLSGTCEKSSVDEFGAEAIVQKIKDSVTEMDLMLEDPELNKPLPEQKFGPALDSKSCRWCNFREICTVGGVQSAS